MKTLHLNRTAFHRTSLVSFFLSFIFSQTVLSQPCNTPNIGATSVGEPMTIQIGPSKNDVNIGTTVSTMRDLLGVNVAIYQLENNKLSQYTALNIQGENKTALDVFSHFRVFYPCHRDYWVFGDGPLIPLPNAEQVPRNNMRNLRLITSTAGVPLLASNQSGKTIYPVASTTVPGKIDLISEPLKAIGGYYNVYQNYMNDSWIKMQASFDYLKNSTQLINKKFSVTLEVIPANFEQSSAYEFPNTWFLANDWGLTDAERKLNAKAYAMMFARTYSPKASDCATCPRMVDNVEIGNEPWGYTNPTTYHAIIEGFIEGINDYYGTDTLNKIRILPASFQAHHPETAAAANVFDITSWKDYINTRLPASTKCDLEGINLHLYSNTIDGTNLTLNNCYPEKVLQNGTQTTAISKFYTVRNAVKWLKDNSFTKKNIHITEFGWDSEGCSPDKSVGVKTQAIYTIRNLLMMSRYGVRRANLYQIEDDPNVGCGYAYFASGVWTPQRTPKYIFKALENFVQKIGDTKFHYALREDPNDVHAYILEKQDQPKYMVAWLARNINYVDDTKTLSEVIKVGGADLADGVGALKSINISFNGKVFTPDSTQAWYRLDGETASPLNQSTFYVGGQYKLSPVPILIPIVETCGQDSIAPVFANCPANIVKTTADSVAIATWTAPTTTDNCTSTPSVTRTHNSGAAFPVGTTTVTYTVRDNKNNTATCSFTVTVVNTCINDTTAPVITCPSNINLTTSGNSAIAIWTPPVATDNCGMPSVVSTPVSGSSFPLGVSTVTSTATDAKNNKSSCTFTVTVINPCANDRTAPIFTNCPANIAKTTIDSAAIATWTIPAATDNCTTNPLVVGSHNSGATFKLGVTTVQYVATDSSGNVANCAFTVTVTNPCAADTLKPIFSNCPANIAQTTTGTTATVTWTPPTASDNCTASPVVTSSHISGASFPISVTTVTYTAKDAKNNTATCSFTVSISAQPLSYCASKATEPWQDWVSGVKFGTIDNMVQANEGKSRNFSSVGYSDFTDLQTTVLRGQTYPLSITPGFSWAGRLPDLHCRAWIDFNGNKTFEDAEKVFEGKSLAQFSANVLIPATVVAGVTRMRVSVKSGGYPTPCESIVQGEVEDYSVKIETDGTDCVNDKQSPELVNCPTNISQTTTGTTAIVNWTLPTATDNCGPAIITSSQNPNTAFPLGETTVIYTATDARNNASSCTFTVTITSTNVCNNDTIAPVFANCPANIVKTTADTAAIATWTSPTATDNCTTTPTITSSHNSGASFKIGVTTVTYTAKDAKSNTATCSFTVTVTNPCANDTLAPVFANCPANIVKTTADTAAIATWTSPTATDNCTTTPTITSSHNAGASFKIGVTAVTYTAKDAKNNTETCSFTVTVTNPCATDTIAPVLANCPANIALTATVATAVATWTAPTATDNCTTAPNITSNFSSGATFPVGVTTVTYTAKDAKNNKTTCSFTVTVSAPVLNYCAAKSTEPWQDWVSGVKFGTINNTAQANEGKFRSVVGYTDFTDLQTAVNRGQSYPLSIIPGISWAGRLPDLHCRVWIDFNGNKTFEDTEKVLEGRTLNPFNGNVTIPPSAISGTVRMRVIVKGGGYPTACESFTSGEVEDYLINIAGGADCSTDTEAPVFANCPANIVKTTADTAAIATWTVPTATDNCTTTPTITSSHNSGASFKIGATTVTYTAKDAKNNTATCSFTITVTNPCANDTIAPVFANCPANIVKTTADTAAIATWTVPTATDNCTTTPTITSSHNSGASFKIGVTTVTYTAKDAKNNIATCSFTVTVTNPCANDTEAPVFANCPANIVKTTADTAAIATWTVPTATDNCTTTPTITSSHNSGASFKIGVTTVTYTAKDTKNNTATCSFTVTVSAPNLNYCASKATEPWQDWVAGVQFGTINNMVQANEGKSKDFSSVGYSNFTDLQTFVNRRQSYPLSIKAGASWSGRLPLLNCRVWIDYNGNKTFEDNEKVFEGTAQALFNSSISIPANAAVGNTRMRVSIKSGGMPTPCESIVQGEVEDYGIIIQ